MAVFCDFEKKQLVFVSLLVAELCSKFSFFGIKMFLTNFIFARLFTISYCLPGGLQSQKKTVKNTKNCHF